MDQLEGDMYNRNYMSKFKEYWAILKVAMMRLTQLSSLEC